MELAVLRRNRGNPVRRLDGSMSNILPAPKLEGLAGAIEIATLDALPYPSDSLSYFWIRIYKREHCERREIITGRGGAVGGLAMPRGER